MDGYAPVIIDNKEIVYVISEIHNNGTVHHGSVMDKEDIMMNNL